MYQPALMKYGILNLPAMTLLRMHCNVEPSNGRAPHTSTYSTTPRLCKPTTNIHVRYTRSPSFRENKNSNNVSISEVNFADFRFWGTIILGFD